MNDSEFVRKDLHDANIDTLLILNDKVNERINDLKDDISRQITLFGIVIGALQIGRAIVFYFLTKY